MDILSRLRNEVLVLDGAMGTLLLDRSGCMEELNIKEPDIVRDVHEKYIMAGADIIETNTFGANPYKLRKQGLEGKAPEINRMALKLARKAAGAKNFVAGSIGPLGSYLQPLGQISFEEAYDCYLLQAKSLKGVDLFLIETISDVRVAKAAILACKTVGVPVFVSFTFQNKRTSLGTDLETFSNTIGSMDIEGLGINCSTGPDEFLGLVEDLVKLTDLPLIVYPNAGLPKMVKEKAVYDYDPMLFAESARRFASLGVNIVGGCCGTDPRYIKEINKKVKGIRPKKRQVKYIPKLSSRTRTISLDKPLLVGERINPTGRQDIQQSLRKKNPSLIKKEAIEQQKSGMHLLDINAGLPDIDEEDMLQKILIDVQEIVKLPLMIDTTSAKALESALKNSNGRVIINSVNASDQSLSSVFPLAKRYGAMVIGLTLDSKQIPNDPKGRVRLARKIIEFGSRYIRKDDIVIDPIIGTISAEPDRAIVTLDTIRRLKGLGIRTNLGISNVSHGLPKREVLNSSFLSMALNAGLDIAIINPYEQRVIEAFYASNALDQIDKSCNDYIDFSTDITTIKRSKITSPSELVIDAVIHGDTGNISGLVERLLDKVDPMKANDILIGAINKVGELYDKKKIFLPQMIESAKAMKEGFKVIKQRLPAENKGTKGRILFATVKGDIHDIGKNIVITLLEANNFDVIDLGVDIGYETIKKAMIRHKPDVIGLSTLMTTTVRQMESIVERLRRDGMSVPIIVGGAVINEQYAGKIKTKYAKDAINALKKIQALLG